MSARKRLLVVDDSKVSRVMIRAYALALRPDWEVAEAADGQEGLRMALDSVFDYVTVDINMPGMDGLALTAQLRAECPQMRVCILSANIQAASQRRAAELQAGFVRKPVNEQAVAEVIRFFEAAER